MNIKLGRNRIERLMRDLIEKYKTDTGHEFNASQTPSNYAGLANKLTERAKELHEIDSAMFPESNYNITATQIRNAYYAQVDNLKDYFYEACNLYLYNKLSKHCISHPELLDVKIEEVHATPKNYRKHYYFTLLILLVLLISFIAILFKWLDVNKQYDTIRKDLHILPYIPTQAEVDQVEGVWEVYTGSPQVRLSGDRGYKKTVSNVMEITYKNGYFNFKRAGPAFSQLGYIQFEAPGLISIHSYYNNDTAVAVSPKHSLMRLEPGKQYMNAISASWSFDPKPADDIIIGIREVFTKLGRGGSIQIIRDARENALFPGMGIVHWVHENKKVDTLFQKIQSLDSLPLEIQKLVDKNSILLKDPDPSRLPSSILK